MSFIFNKFMYSIGFSGGGATNTSTDWMDSGVIFKAALVTGYYSQSAVTQNYWSDVAGCEYPTGALGANNYASGGSAIIGRTIAEDGSNPFADYKAGNNTFTALSGNVVVSGVMVYHAAATAAASELVAWLDGSAFPKTANGGDFTIAWNGGTVFRITGG